MKNKKLTYLLIFLVSAIWIKIIWNIKESTSPENIVEFESTELTIPRVKMKSDTFKLSMNYRDPFSKKTIVKKTEHKARIRPVVIEIRNSDKIKKEIKWPSIHYTGSITNSSENRKMALIKRNNKEVIAYEGEYTGDLRVDKIYNDSVLITYANTTKTFYK